MNRFRLVLSILVLLGVGLDSQEKGLMIKNISKENGGNRWAIVVGVNHYDDTDIPGLKKAVNDAKGFANSLIDYGQFDKNRVFLMTEEEERENKPTKSKIEQKLEYILEMSDSDDLLIFYFSGHGITDKNTGKGYLIPSDANDRKLLQTSLNIEEIVTEIKKKGIRKSILMLDACRNEFGESKKSLGTNMGLNSKIFQNAEVSATFYSTKDQYFSYEDHESEYGVYTRYLLEGIQGGADSPQYGGNGDGVVTFRELQTYVGLMVDEWSLRNQKKQRPFTKFTRETFGDIAISLSSSGSRINAEEERRDRLARARRECGSRGGIWDEDRSRCREKNELDREEADRIAREKRECQARRGIWQGSWCKERSEIEAEELASRISKCEGEGGFYENGKCVKQSTVAGKTFKNSIGMEFVQIPAGSFMMGCSSGDGDCESDENPGHRVSISKPFYMGKYEVTQGQWWEVMGSNPSYFTSCGNGYPNTCPVEKVSWNDIQVFLEKLNAKERGRKYRLPTEAEWEYAARAGGKTKYYWGNEVNDSYLWYDGNSGGTTHPVGQKKPNAWGLYDMIGNVYEWTGDWYDSGYYGKSPSSDPKGAESGEYRVLRGGSWDYDAERCRLSSRDYIIPDIRFRNRGFRLVLLP